MYPWRHVFQSGDSLTPAGGGCYSGAAPKEPALRHPDYRWIILATGFIVLFFSGGSRFAFGLVLKPMSDDLGWSRSSLSLVITVFMVVSAVGMPVMGRLIDRFSLRWVIGTAALAGAVGVGLMGRVTAPWHMFVLYGVVYAIGNAGTSVAPVSVMISRWFPGRVGTASSGAISGNAVGQLVIIMVLASILASIGWSASYTALGLANLVLVPLVLLTVRSAPTSDLSDAANGPDTVNPSATGPATHVPLSRILASRQLWLLIGLYAICGFQDFFVATHVVAFAQDQGVGARLAGNLLALMGLMGLLGVLASGALADAFGAARPTALCFLIRIGAFAFIIYSQSTPSVVVFGLLYGFTFLITAPLTVVFTGNIFGPARLGTVSGLINMVHQVSGGLGAFTGAVIFDRWEGYDRAFILMLVLALVATALILLVRERGPAPT